MVSLYGKTLDLIYQRYSSDPDYIYYANWNWLINSLTKFIYNKVYADLNSSNNPNIPDINDDNVWSKWYFCIMASLKKEFYDVTNKHLLLRCLENVPTEEVAILIYESTSVELLLEFVTYLEESIIMNNLLNMLPIQY